MRILLLLILLFHSAFSAQLLNENIYERDNRIDLMLSFDTPFAGGIKKRVAADGTVQMILTGVELKKPFRKNLQNDFVESIAVVKRDDKSAAVLIVPKSDNIRVTASKTIDGFGLRLRILPPSTATIATEQASTPVATATVQPQGTPLNTLDASKSMPGWRYWAVMGILLFLLVILWIVKKRAASGVKSGMGGWLLPKNRAGGQGIVPEAQIRYQKALDPHNRLLLLEFSGKQYLMVVGNSNLLLDTFAEGHIDDEESFSQMFENNKRQLDHFLKEKHPDAYEIFKSNASKEEHL